jgi:hypothetical protein
MNMIGATPTRANTVASEPRKFPAHVFECRTADSLNQAQGLRGCKCRTLVAILAGRNQLQQRKARDPRLQGAPDESCAKVGFPLPPFPIHDVHHVHHSRPKLHSAPPSARRFSRALQRVASSIRSERTCTRGNVRLSSHKLPRHVPNWCGYDLPKISMPALMPAFRKLLSSVASGAARRLPMVTRFSVTPLPKPISLVPGLRQVCPATLPRAVRYSSPKAQAAYLVRNWITGSKPNENCFNQLT